MRTNIEIDDELMAEAMAVSSIRTKREVIDQALQPFVRLQKQTQIRQLRGKIEWIGDLDEMRRD